MSRLQHVFALIPAAGKSTRMGRPKLALPLGDRTVLEQVVAALRRSDLDRILVALGPQTPGLANLARTAGAEVLELPSATADMRATVERGMDWIEQHWHPDADHGLLLCPADHPLLDATVVEELLAARHQHPAATIFIPTFEGKRGHPVLFGWSHVPSIRALPPDQGLNSYFRLHISETQEVPVASPDILCDLDTPEDYERLCRRWTSS
jgi:molybdenum cofactor cytidylyltransferase